MTRLRIPKVVPKPKDFSKIPWTEEFRDKYPTRKAEKYFTEGMNYEDFRDFLFAEKHVDFRKASLMAHALRTDKGIVRNDNEILLTINFPYCEWRCVNCKRNMYQRAKYQDAYLYYFDAIMREIKLTREIIAKKCYIVKAICYTGNLLALDALELEKVLSQCTYTLSEINVELGNPKFITQEKLAILKKYNVTRIIVNALTFNTVSLRKLCRRYEFKEVYDSFKLIAEFGFDLNIELLVGLPQEHELQLGRNIKLAVELGATGIDLFSRFCPLGNNIEVTTDKNLISEQRKLLEYTSNTMKSFGFNPYFLYCTEVESGCFENVGYTIPNKTCKYLEDKNWAVSTMLGCGLNTETTIVKNLHNTRKSMRNTYDLGQYILGIDEILEKKRKFFE